jgi:cell division protein FtsZ
MVDIRAHAEEAEPVVADGSATKKLIEEARKLWAEREEPEYMQVAEEKVEPEPEPVPEPAPKPKPKPAPKPKPKPKPKKVRKPKVERPPELPDASAPKKKGTEMPNKDDDDAVDLPQTMDPLYAQPSAPKKRKKKAAPAVEEEDSGGGIDLPDAFLAAPKKKKKDRHKDKFEGAVKMAFIGAGQGGGRIAQSFYDMGYRRVCAVNTTDQDLSGLTMPNKLLIGNDRGGAGKDPKEGEAAARESYEDIMDLLMRSWGEGVEQVFVCVGGGGGSGTGSWPVIVDAMREYCKSTNVEKPITKHLGVIMTMPKRSEGSRVQRNAHTAIEKAVSMVDSQTGGISTLVIVDNAKIHDLFPRLPVKKFWPAANANFAAMFHTFNLLAAMDSDYNTFDRADFRSVLRNGMLIFGMTPVEDYEEMDDISQAVRQNLKSSLLADGFDLSTADMAGAIVVAHDDVLGEIPMENIDYAFNSLSRALGNENITLHSGIYEGRREGMQVFTIVSGLEPPRKRMDELENLAR